MSDIIKYRGHGAIGNAATEGMVIFGTNDQSELTKENYYSLLEFEKHLLSGCFDPNTRDRFTGMLDQNKNEIFENDWFTWGHHSEGIVKFKKGQWVIDSEKGDFPLYGYCDEGEVVADE